MRCLVGLPLLLLVLPSLAAAQARPGAQQGLQRSRLEAQVLQRFASQAGARLGLAEPDRQRLGVVLRTHASRRAALASEARTLRRELGQALSSTRATDADFERILGGLERLREDELRLWREEQRSLAEFMGPRQRAGFLALRAQFNQRVIELQRRDRPRSPPDPMRR
ncbi:MAG: hypothetical protein ACRELD_12335 [Longimicrobiales bacterium]